MNQSQVFSLDLANGHCWQFVSDEPCNRLTESLAAVADLKRSVRKNVPRVIMSRDEPLPSSDGLWRVSQSLSRLADDIPGDGWTVQSVGHHIRLMSHRDCEDHICVVGKQILDGHLVGTLWPVLFPVFWRVEQDGGLVAHSGLLARDERGVLLVAPSGTGKSTCARRVGYPWSALCDDQVLVVKVGEGRYHCHPLPTWSALWGWPNCRSWNVHRHVPLDAIFFLERSDCNHVQPMGQAHAVARLTMSAQSMATTRDDRPKQDGEMNLKRIVFDNVCALVKSASCFLLHTHLASRFWEQMERVM